MKKLRLQVEDLAIDSFATDAERQDERGTVHGRQGDESFKVICGVSTLKTDMTCCPCTPGY